MPVGPCQLSGMLSSLSCNDEQILSLVPYVRQVKEPIEGGGVVKDVSSVFTVSVCMSDSILYCLQKLELKLKPGWTPSRHAPGFLEQFKLLQAGCSFSASGSIEVETRADTQPACTRVS